MATSVRSPWTRTILGATVLALFTINVVNAIRRGGDLDAYLDAARRLLSGTPLYTASGIAHGFVGPPAQALVGLPLMMVGAPVERIAWATCNSVLLWYSVLTWAGLLLEGTGATEAGGTAASRPEPSAWRRGLALVQTAPGLPAMLLPLFAVSGPLVSQLEHQNLNIVLLALAACAAESLTRGRTMAAGVALGVAAALKVYPAAALIWLAARSHWSALGWAVAAGVGLGMAPALFSGLDGFLVDLADWRALAASGWPVRRANQSLAAAWERFLLGGVPAGATLTLARPGALWLAAATSLVAIVPLAVAVVRVPSRPAAAAPVAEELACVNALALLLSPIAWEHYWLGFFPLFLIADQQARRWPSTRQRRCAGVAFWTGAVCMTLLSRPVIGWHGARVVRGLSLSTWAGLFLCATVPMLLAHRAKSGREQARAEREEGEKGEE